MRKHHSDMPEYFPEPDSGTYQTGSTQPPKTYRGVIAVLLIAVTTLGSLASALGILNIRLLAKLEQMNAENSQLSLLDNSTQNTLGDQPQEAEVPQIPGDHQLALTFADTMVEIPMTPQQILSKNADSTVTVQCITTCGQVNNLLGVVVDPQGYILTNAASVSDASRIYITLPDGRNLRAALVGADRFTDVAVLYIDAQGLSSAEFFASDALQEGDFLAALCAHGTLDAGTVGQHRDTFQVGNDKISMLSTDLPHVGGPIFNGAGQIVGFGSRFLTSCCETGVALSSETIRDILGRIMQWGTIPGRPSLSLELEEVEEMYQRYWDLPGGLRITAVPEELSQALAVGDILTTLNGVQTPDWEAFYGALWKLQPGDTVEITVFRDGESFPATITITAS